MKTMKFIIKSTSVNYGRKGILSEIAGKPDIRIETPALMMYTKGGSIPHLTFEVLEMLTKDSLILQAPLLTTLHMDAGIRAQNKGLCHFTGMDEHMSFVVFQDPCIDVRLGKFETDKMPLWTRTGKKHLNADMYMDVIENFKPNFYAVISDNCTNDSSTKKRISKSVDRSREMLERCIERHKKSDHLKNNSSIFGVIVGGNSLNDRKEFMKSILKHSEDLDGFILDGIDYNGSQIQNITYENIENVVKTVTSLLPEDKLRIVQGCWNPVTLLDLVQQGWDVFDSTLPHLATEKGCCLTFDFDISNENNPKTYEIDLKEKSFKDDLSSVLDKCECLCCRKYTKAYIHHLLNTRELLSNVLIMIHNLHHYMKFFEAIRANASSEAMSKLRNLIHLQYANHKENKEEKDKITIDRTKTRRFSSDESNSEDNPTTQNDAMKI